MSECAVLPATGPEAGDCGGAVARRHPGALHLQAANDAQTPGTLLPADPR